MKKIIICLVVFSLCISLIPSFVPVVNASPTIWYVATTGNDTTGAGTLAKPYATLRKAINSSGNGDTIYMRAGKYTSGYGTTGIYINRSGTSRTQHFTIATYPPDLAAGNRAILDASGYVISSSHGILTIAYKTSAYYNNITVNGLSLENSSWNGIFIDNTATGKTSDVKVNDCLFKNISRRAYYIYQPYVSSSGYISNMTLSNCSFWKIEAGSVSGEGITFMGCRDFVFENNTILWDAYIGVAFSAGSTRGRACYNNIHVNCSGREGEGLYIDPEGENDATVSWINVYHNVFWGTTGAYAFNGGLKIDTEIAGGRVHNISIYNNIFNISGSTHMAPGIRIGNKENGMKENIQIKYNTIYTRNNADSSCIYNVCPDAYLKNFVIANNILIAGASVNYELKCDSVPSTSTKLIRANNLYYKIGGSANTHYSDMNGFFETGSIKNDNPDIVSLATYNFHLNETSPAIDAATSSHIVNIDYDGITRPQGYEYDIGAYEYIEGSSQDTSPPTPNPSTWAIVPYGASSTSISMTATTATDPSPPVQYYFDETTGNPGGTDSGWQTSSSYTDTGLTTGITYTYRVQTRDAIPNTGSWSTSYSAIPSDTTLPVISQVDIMTSNPIDVLAGYGWENITCVVTDNVEVSAVLLKCTNPDQSTSNIPMIKKTGTSTYYTNQSLHQPGNYTYRIQATDTSNNVVLSSSYILSLPPNWDIDHDGVVTILDLVLVSNHYAETGYNGWIQEDVDNNGVIQSLDIVLVSEHFGESWWL
jgi:hypothetical protein